MSTGSGGPGWAKGRDRAAYTIFTGWAERLVENT